jgi:hypothetical protein
MAVKRTAGKASTKKSGAVPRGGPGGAAEVDAFLKSMTDPRKPILQALRGLILGTDRRIVEGIKWNAPSFHHEDWFATTNLRGKAGVMLVLHTGAKVKASATTGVAIEDPRGLLTWLAPDRAVITFLDQADLKARAAALRKIIRQWVELM